MPTPDNHDFAGSNDFPGDDISIGELLSVLAEHKDKPLLFSYGGRTVKPGYHVTEVKAGAFAALDCGANPEAWTELFVQLWDVDEDGRTHMPAGKFSAIIGKVGAHVALDPGARLTFEVSDGIAAIQLHKASMPLVQGGEVHVQLSARASSCKPRDRWLVEQAKATTACCGPAKGDGQPCCS